MNTAQKIKEDADREESRKMYSESNKKDSESSDYKKSNEETTESAKSTTASKRSDESSSSEEKTTTVKKITSESSSDSSSDEKIAHLIKSIESNSSSKKSMEKTTAMNDLLLLPANPVIILDSPFVVGNTMQQAMIGDDWLSLVYDNLLGIGMVPDAAPQAILGNNTRIITKASFT